MDIRVTRLTAAFFLPVLGLLMLIGAFVAFTAHWSAGETDAESIQRETTLVRRLLDQRIADVTRNQQTSTTWDDAVNVVIDAQDPDWLDANLGIWMHVYFGIDRVFILDGEDHSIYAMIGGSRSRPDSYFSHAGLLEPIATQLRQLRTAAASLDEAPTFVRRYVLLENRPAVVSAAAILSDTGNISQVAGEEPVHLAVEFLDGPFLAKLAADFLIQKPRFSWTGRIGDHEAAFPLAANGADLGYLVWTVQQPGTKVFDRMMPILVAAGMVILLLAGLLLFRLYRTTSKLISSQRQIEYMAHHDPLTGLANRFAFETRLGDRIREFEQTRRSFAVLYLDLDRFKDVNDTLGHQAGDELIRQVAGRLASLVRQEDMVARLGGDEFAVLRDSVADRAEIEILSRRIVDAIQNPFEMAKQQVIIGISIGVAIAFRDTLTQMDLVRRADVALYRVKNSGRGGYAIFEERMERPTSRKLVRA
ncbi:diguanylate cyclase domain-containing protein [Aurantimonas sp. VKM B-3413]|uniref:diguanylate cyclase domain-containing protein n=1 Tax=Aurantimonas sp. VKM B-3413 TaxID=2779401 RepID=UPI001E4A932F|nr:diguanylate cyclase [Aurantimonas sp. VKM B-3413]MCB8836807.1 diguanylate cyclase [Aurantimonas sp. VKM B-3413]